MWSRARNIGLGIVFPMLILQAGVARSQTPLPFPLGENVVDGTNKPIGRVTAFNHVVVHADGLFAALPFSIRGLLASRGLNPDDFDADSQIIYHPKRDCRGTPFIKSDKATVPYRAYPIGVEPFGNSTLYFRTVEYYAPVQQAFGISKYMFSFRNLVTGLCTEGTYFGIFLEAKKLSVSATPPLFLK